MLLMRSPSNTVGVCLSKEYPRTVTVFGFPPDAASYILSLFQNYGQIVQCQHVGNSNWMNVEYATEVAAQMALGKNGMIVGGDVMVGVVPMRKQYEQVVEEQREKRLSAVLSPVKSGQKKRSSPEHFRDENRDIFMSPSLNAKRPLIGRALALDRNLGSPMVNKDETSTEAGHAGGNWVAGMMESILGWRS